MSEQEKQGGTVADRPIVAGDLVRVRDPAMYIRAFARAVENRDGVVLWVGPTVHNMFKGQACVKFLKRNGRGKEFQEVLRVKDLVLQTAQESEQGQNGTLQPPVR